MQCSSLTPVASREEQKRRRREERLAREQAEAKKAARKRLIGRAGGVAFALVAIAIAVFAVTSSGGGSEKKSGTAAKGVPIPKQQNEDLVSSARAAGCELRDFPSYGQQHTTDKVTYKSNPPTSGPHDPTPAQDGSYAAANPPAVGQSVHAHEHGRVDIQWKPGLPQREIGQLQTLFDEQGGARTLLFANQTSMPYQVAASAWQHFLGCPKFGPKVFDAIRNFRDAYAGKGPEQVP